MTDDQILDAMTRYGGSFVRTLADLYRRGDPENQAKLRATFADYWDDYTDTARLHEIREGRAKGDDDGVEYADPRDYRDGRE